jgi:hypothetical protein
MKCAWAILSFLAYSTLQYFSKLSHKQQDFGRKKPWNLNSQLSDAASCARMTESSACKLVPVHAMVAHRGSKGTAPLILNLDTLWRWVFNLPALPLHPVKVKGKGTPNRPEGPYGGRGIALLFLDLGTRRGMWSAPRPGRFTPGKDPVPIV